MSCSRLCYRQWCSRTLSGFQSWSRTSRSHNDQFAQSHCRSSSRRCLLHSSESYSKSWDCLRRKEVKGKVRGKRRIIDKGLSCKNGNHCLLLSSTPGQCYGGMFWFLLCIFIIFATCIKLLWKIFISFKLRSEGPKEFCPSSAPNLVLLECFMLASSYAHCAISLIHL